MKKNRDKHATHSDSDVPENVEHREPSATSTSDSTDGESEIEQVARERDRAQDQLTRAMADLQNIRKRHIKEMDDARKRSVEGLASELLPVLDNFHLALAAHDQSSAQETNDSNAMVEGLRMVRSLLLGVLERHGLAEIPSIGKVFDPNIHEAVGVDPTAEVPPGHISRVMLTGYTLSERVVRPAKVMVAAESQAGSSTPGDPEES